MICSSALAQKSSSESFTGQSKFDSCKEEIPLYYATKKKGPLLEAAARLKEIEIAYVSIGKKKKVKFDYFYLVVYDAQDGKSTFLQPSDAYAQGAKLPALFIDYNPKKDFFFRADCFRGIYDNDTDLKALIVKGI